MLNEERTLQISEKMAIAKSRRLDKKRKHSSWVCDLYYFASRLIVMNCHLYVIFPKEVCTLYYAAFLGNKFNPVIEHPTY